MADAQSVGNLTVGASLSAHQNSHSWISPSADFEVLLLELTCCRRSVDMESGNEERAILTDWAYDCYCEGTVDLLVENDDDALNDIAAKLERFVQVAIYSIPPCPCPYALTS
ncbi:receptor-like protein kinase 1 [Hibiscus trionum]|uniref:Receptor-like protein kinase 1 n=1 Tax=Hibiscus trionum TaxID=183268 RepID=A0A9W7M0H2_HIBTR|nr:receptor-like protein kinase 1 [Hibiscus trionum]